MTKCRKVRNIELMDDYLQARLSEADKEAFERHYFECDRCFEELKFREHLMQACREHGQVIFSDVLRGRGAAGKGGLAGALARLFPGPLWTRKWIYAAAVSVIILMMMSTFFTFSGRNKYEHLAKIKPYPYLLSGLRNGASNGESLFQEGMRFYTNGDYNHASERLERVVALDSENVLAQFYLGVCSLMLEKPERAIRHLERASVTEPDIEIFHWYLGQAYLKKGNGERALLEFERVRGLNGEFRTRAETLIGEIEKIKKF
jgi:tetratricopeptide (TPR) repeat protein